MKPYFLPLNGEFYDKFKSGEQKCEIRPANHHGWNSKNIFPGRELLLSRGYGKRDRHCRTIKLALEGRAEWVFFGIPQWHIDAVEAIYGKRDRWLVAYVSDRQTSELR